MIYLVEPSNKKLFKLMLFHLTLIDNDKIFLNKFVMTTKSECYLLLM